MFNVCYKAMYLYTISIHFKSATERNKLSIFQLNAEISIRTSIKQHLKYFHSSIPSLDQGFKDKWPSIILEHYWNLITGP